MDAFRGLALLVKTPRLWGWAALPGSAAVFLYMILAITLWSGLQPVMESLLGEWKVTGWVLALIVFLLVFPLAFFLLGSAFLGLIFDPLAYHTEAIQGGAPPAMKLTRKALVSDAFARLGFNAAVGVIGFLIGLMAPFLAPLLSILAAAIVGVVDYTAPASLRRGRTLGPQLRDFLARPDAHAIGFALSAGFLSLVPLLGLMLAPAFVIGGTLLVRRRDLK